MTRPTSKQRRAKQARALLENEALTDIFDEREAEIVQRWKGSDSPDKREACYHELIALEGLRDAIYASGTDDR